MNVRTDVVDVYVFRRAPVVQFLQLLRVRPPLEGTWQPVMGHVEAGETAVACAERELGEEVGLTRAGMVGFWALQAVHPYFLPPDSVVLSPRFAAEVGRGWEPVLNGEHSGHRWVAEGEVGGAFLWLGQQAACREVLDVIIPGLPASGQLRL